MRKIFWSLFEIVETIVIAVAAVFLIRTFVAQPFLVSGSSMEPNFYDGDYLLIDELTYRLRQAERGEVIVFKYPGNPSSYYIKRVIGLPGERVVIDGDKVMIFNGDQKLVLKEEYVLSNRRQSYFETTLKTEQYFVMGDNRDFSFDSRSWGALKGSEIIGLVRFRLWPVNQVMAFTAPAY